MAELAGPDGVVFDGDDACSRVGAREREGTGAGADIDDELVVVDVEPFDNASDGAAIDEEVLAGATAPLVPFASGAGPPASPGHGSPSTSA